jgi:hypothetical protein
MLAVEPAYRAERDARGRAVLRVAGHRVLRFRYRDGAIERTVIVTHRRRWRAKLRAFLEECWRGG